MIRPLALVLSVGLGTSSALGGSLFPFDPVAVTQDERNELSIAARPFGDGVGVAFVEGGELSGVLSFAIVHFFEDRRTVDTSSHLAVTCGRADGGWVCRDPYRVVTLRNEIPTAVVDVKGDISIAMLQKILKYIKAREGARFVSLSSVEVTAEGKFAVDVIHPDGGASWLINERDVVSYHD